MPRYRNSHPLAGLSLPGDGLPSGATAVLDAPVPTCDVDTALMLRFQAGEGACFDDLVARFRRPLLGFLFRMLHDAAASEEVLQEAFLRVYLHRLRYRPQARFSTWMYRIVHRLALNYVRDHRHDLRPPAAADSGESSAASASLEPADARPNPEQAMLDATQAHLRQRRIRAAIAALPQRQRAAVVLHKYQGLDHEQVSEVLHLSLSATKSLLFRAYGSLRRELKDLL